MDTADLHSSVDDLSSNIDDLEESLAPLLKTALSHSTSKLPLLDKAKLYVLVTYAIESILFSCLRLNGVEAKSHPVFQELARVKEYFGKIKTAETAGTKRNTTLDREAANRFIKHGLVGNEKHNRERQERIEREKAGAKRKFDEIQVGTHTRFDGFAKKIKRLEAGESGRGTDNGDLTSGTDGLGASAATTDVEMAEPESVEEKFKAEKKAAKAAKRQRRLERRQAEMGSVESLSKDVKSEVDDTMRHASDMHGDNEQRETHEALNSTTEALETLLQGSSPGEEDPTPKKKKRKRKSKAQKLQDDIADEMK